MYTIPQGRISGISSLNLEDGEKLRRDGILLSQRTPFTRVNKLNRQVFVKQKTLRLPENMVTSR